MTRVEIGRYIYLEFFQLILAAYLFIIGLVGGYCVNDFWKVTHLAEEEKHEFWIQGGPASTS